MDLSLRNVLEMPEQAGLPDAVMRDGRALRGTKARRRAAPRSSHLLLKVARS